MKKQYFIQNLIYRIQNQKMGSECSACKVVKQEKQNQIDNVSRSKIEQSQRKQQKITENDDDHHEQKIEKIKPPETKSDKKLIKKRVQIIMPATQSTENSDKVKFKENSIEPNDVEEIKKTMSRHFILSQLNEKQITIAISKMRYCTSNKNQFIFKQGDPSYSYYIILQGNCSVIINGQQKRILNFGDSFGDLGIIYNAPRSASIKANQNCLFAEMNTKTFKQVTQQLNVIYEKENRTFLQTVDFYKQLNQQEKNALASDCLHQTYEEGQVIFNKGDDANSFYIIKQGKVVIKQKNLQLGELQNFGKNSVLHENRCVRSSTIEAKTKCKLISINKQIIRKNLGDSLSSLLKKKQVFTLIKQSEIYKQYQQEYWLQAHERTEFECLKKNGLIFKKNDYIPKNYIYVLIGTDLKNSDEEKIYSDRSIIECDKMLKGNNVYFNQNCFAQFDGFLGKVKVQIKADTIQEDQKVTKMLEKNLNLNDFVVVKKLRAGNFGQVYACYHKIIKKKYAIKVMDRQEIESTGIGRYVMNEEEILKQTPSHPFLIKFYKLIRDKNFICIIMDLLEGEDMFDTMNNILPIPSILSRFYIMQITLVIEHLHKNRVIYRDLKPQNIMMNQDGYLTLVDMGTAKKLNIQKRYKTSTIIGTPHYMAPQIITGKGYSFSVDLWSLGIIMYEFIIGKLPFGDNLDDPFGIYEEIIKSQIKFPRNIDQNSKTFLNRLLNKNNQSRLGNGFEELKNHPYFGGHSWSEIINKKVDPTYKPSSDLVIQQAQIEKALKKTSAKAQTRFLKDKKKK